jgi:H/ACA ribonucleoprotein complex non-core subunit NAF1
LWGYQSGGFQGHQFGQQQQQQSVQPHINPRFASAFGFNGSPAWLGNQEAHFSSYQVQQPSQPWTNQWLVHGQEYENAESDAYTPI